VVNELVFELPMRDGNMGEAGPEAIMPLSF